MAKGDEKSLHGVVAVGSRMAGARHDTVTKSTARDRSPQLDVWPVGCSACIHALPSPGNASYVIDSTLTQKPREHGPHHNTCTYDKGCLSAARSATGATLDRSDGRGMAMAMIRSLVGVTNIRGPVVR